VAQLVERLVRIEEVGGSSPPWSTIIFLTPSSEERNMGKIEIKWQRLLYEGQTCPRCKSTEDELEKAVSILKQSLAPLGIDVVLEKAELSAEEFKKNPLQSNLIWINGQSLEDWLGGKTGQSPCCDICGPFECRTIVLEEKIYEAIPADLVIKAGLAAASQIIGAGLKESCCGSGLSTNNCCSGQGAQ
jgi:hypothetical protein